jgi:hypothetical protein
LASQGGVCILSSVFSPQSHNATVLVFILASTLVGCTDQTTAEWTKQLDPLMVENGLLADQMLLVAAGVYNETSDGAAVAETFATTVVPVSESLAFRADAMQPPKEWELQHDQLVDIWTRRAGAYRGMSEALILIDAERFNGSLKEVQQAAEAEEAWFGQVGGQLAKQGVTLAQYP